MKRILLVILAIPLLVVCTIRPPLTLPEAAFTAEPLSGNAPLEVTFSDLSTGEPDFWVWDFGDGATSKQQHPKHIYDTAGTYDVTLICSNTEGKDTVTHGSYIVVTADAEALGANFTAEPTSGPPPLEVQFADHSTGNPAEWFWDFGDGNSSTEQNPDHKYHEAGSYDVTLIVSNGEAPDTLTKEAYIVVENVEYNEVTKEGITIKWKTDSDNLFVIMSAPTTGWVSVGFDPSADNHKDANIIIGYVKEGIPFVQDNFGTGAFVHASDTSLGGIENVYNATGFEEGGFTEISFAIPLDSGDEYDRVLVIGETYKVILAYGADGSDDFTSKHLRAAIVSITI